MTRVPRWLATMALVYLLVLATVTPTYASDNLNASWKSDPFGVYANYIRFAYHSSVPANFKPRILDGANVWNNQGRELYFQNGSGNEISITYQDLVFPNGDLNAISMTYAGVCFPKICTGSIAFNTTPGIYHFYTGTGTPNGANNEVDLWSVAAHEWGHQVSLTHSGANADTMWSLTTVGDTKQRTLTTHDRQGINAMYPPK